MMMTSPVVTLLLSEHFNQRELAASATVTASLSHASSEATTLMVSAVPVSLANSSDYSLSGERDLEHCGGVDQQQRDGDHHGQRQQ